MDGHVQLKFPSVERGNMGWIIEAVPDVCIIKPARHPELVIGHRNKGAV